jgi:pyridoxamine 5'-phosphate oxidase
LYSSGLFEVGAVMKWELEEIRSWIWDRHRAALTQLDDPWRTPVVATLDSGGVPGIRMVVLRAVNEGAGELTFHTDFRSPKVKALRSTSVLAWVFYDPVLKVQVRVHSRAQLHHKDEIAEQAWSELAPHQQSAYAGKVASGIDLSSGDLSEERSIGPEIFTVVRASVESMDWLWLGPKGHLRALVQREANGWMARWIAP